MLIHFWDNWTGDYTLLTCFWYISVWYSFTPYTFHLIWFSIINNYLIHFWACIKVMKCIWYTFKTVSKVNQNQVSNFDCLKSVSTFSKGSFLTNYIWYIQQYISCTFSFISHYSPLSASRTASLHSRIDHTAVTSIGITLLALVALYLSELIHSLRPWYPALRVTGHLYHRCLY